MTSDIAASIWSAIRGTPAPNRDAVHFHLDGEGRAFVCDYQRCDSPSLTIGEASTIEAGSERRAR
jgi:hypothetical protein